MITLDRFLKTFNSLGEEEQEQVLDFAEFLVQKKSKKEKISKVEETEYDNLDYDNLDIEF